jgi:Aspartyl protease
MKSWQFMIVILVVCSFSIVGQSSRSTNLSIEFEGSMPRVKAMINGKGPFQFTLDTGARMQAAVNSTVITQLKLQPNGQVRVSDPSGRNPKLFDTVVLDSISLGDVEFRNVPAVSQEPRMGPNDSGADGVLGLSLFSEYLLTLDYPCKQLNLSHGGLPMTDGAAVLAYENSEVTPVVEITIGNTKMKAHIDSGNMVGSFNLPTTLVEKLHLTSQPITIGRVRTVSDEIEMKEARLSDNIKMGSFVFSQPTITFPSIAGEVNIGLKTLREFSITFDQKNKRVKFERKLC